MNTPLFRFSAGREAAIKRRIVTLLTKGQSIIAYHDAVSNSEKKKPSLKEVQAFRVLLESVLPQFNMTIHRFFESECQFWVERIREKRVKIIDGVAYLWEDGELPVLLGEVKEYVSKQV